MDESLNRLGESLHKLEVAIEKRQAAREQFLADLIAMVLGFWIVRIIGV